MGIFDKIKQMKADYDAKKAAEAAELLALCNRLRQNEIFLNYADALYETLRNPGDENIKWATGRSREEDGRRLAIALTTNDFGLVQSSYYEQKYYDSNDNFRIKRTYVFNPIDVRKFADYGMQQLPNKAEVMTAVLETLASRLKEIDYLSLSQGCVKNSSGDHVENYDAILIDVSSERVQKKRTAW